MNFFKKLFIRKNKHILDGPGMVNPFVWDKFTVSRSGDSYAQHNFDITVVKDYPKYILTGSLRDEHGIYEEEKGIVISGSNAEKIRVLDPEALPDVREIILNEEENEMLEGCEILDASSVSIVVQYTDGKLQRKVDADDFSLKLYNAVLPYFRKKCKNVF